MTPDPSLLERIYRRPEFVWARFVRAAEDWLYNLFRNIFSDDSAFPWIIFGVIAVLVAIGLVWWLAGRSAQPRRWARPASARGAAAVEPAQLEEEASAYARRGDWAAAIRHLFRAFVLQLDRQGRLRHDPARTNRELRRLLAHGPGLANPGLVLEPHLGHLIVAAEAVTYAGVTGDQALWQQTEAAYRALLRQLQAGGDSS